jgi:hypothetical protein
LSFLLLSDMTFSKFSAIAMVQFRCWSSATVQKVSRWRHIGLGGESTYSLLCVNLLILDPHGFNPDNLLSASRSKSVRGRWQSIESVRGPQSIVDEIMVLMIDVAGLLIYSLASQYPSAIQVRVC